MLFSSQNPKRKMRNRINKGYKVFKTVSQYLLLIRKVKCCYRQLEEKGVMIQRMQILDKFYGY